MIDESVTRTNNDSRILLYSLRNIEKVHFRCSLYEFEDVICEIDSVDMLTPKPKKWFKHGSSVAQRLAASLGLIINPGIKRIERICRLGPGWIGRKGNQPRRKRKLVRKTSLLC